MFEQYIYCMHTSYGANGPFDQNLRKISEISI